MAEVFDALGVWPPGSINRTDEKPGIPLFDRIESIQNDLKLAILAINLGHTKLIPTALENAFSKLQDVIESNCVKNGSI